MVKLLLLSHGQATVERGFSFNKQIEVENLQERSFLSQRLVQDYIRSVGGTLNVPITKQLILSAGAARQRYVTYLDEQKKKKKEKQQMILKRKCVTDKINETRKKKSRVEMDVDALLKSAD